ncbi:MAG TPA: NAD+ synthase [Permianibacter sp.]|nr:NAD+ synthase [Permianibacter sp.]
MQIALAQVNVVVGDMVGNVTRLRRVIEQAKANGARLLVCSEQVLCAYPAEDLVLRADFQRAVDRALRELADVARGIAVVVGHPERDGEQIYNAASVLLDGQVLARYRKQRLPNYLVFDEKRYFAEGHETCVFTLDGVRIGLLICEDLWHPEPIAAAKAAGAEFIVSPNGSPWHRQQAAERAGVLAARTQETGLPIVYVNQVGGQDELVFDGRSQVWTRAGRILLCEPFAEDLRQVRWQAGHMQALGDSAIDLSEEEEIYRALVLGVRDYVQKSGFKGVILGLSGGIDSALVLAVAVDALGADKVRAVMMPYHYTADISVEDARREAQILGAQFDIISIEPMVKAFLDTLAPQFAGTAVDLTEQNLQARCRGTLLMALSNKFGYLVLTTGNKSEMGVGYATLYGDMAGGFDVLKDVPKMTVYALSRWRNRNGEVIPQRVIDRPPSAELAPDQKDEDNLPPYPVLDAILERYIERDEGLPEMVAAGFDAATVKRVMQLVDRNEYKRRQAAPGPRISKRAFGRDRRYPIVSGFIKQPDDWR